MRFREFEPKYKGKKMSEWAEIYESSLQPDGPTDSPERREAVEAVRNLRDQVLPRALELICKEKPDWKGSMEQILESKMEVRRWCPTRVWAPFYRNPADEGSVYFEMLGPDAGSAVPELVRIINHTESFNTSERAMDALSSIGAASLPSLTQMLADPANPRRRRAVCAIGDMMDRQPAAAKSAIPLVVKCLNNSDFAVRYAATNALNEFAPDVLASAH
jgi:hypothetical protein